MVRYKLVIAQIQDSIIARVYEIEDGCCPSMQVCNLRVLRFTLYYTSIITLLYYPRAIIEGYVTVLIMDVNKVKFKCIFRRCICSFLQFLLTVMCCIVPCRAVPCRAVPCNAVMCCAVMWCDVVHYTTLRYTKQHCIAPHSRHATQRHATLNHTNTHYTKVRRDYMKG